jgi:uncharacterized membrane protein
VLHVSVKKNSHNRFWEIDLLRGIAILMMIVFHFLYDLNYFNIYKIELYSGFSFIFVYLVGTMFFLLVGISLTLSYSRTKNTLTKKNLQLKYLKRGAGIFGLGLLVTLATWIYLGGRGFVVFGVLHCIGLSIIFAYPFLRFRYQNLVLGIVLISAGMMLKTLTFDFNWLLWLGFTPSNFYTVDYYPLLPWLGVVLIGIFVGNSLYQNNERKFKLKDHSQFIVVRFTCFLGGHALLIYLVHQPVLIGLLYLFTI